MLFTFRMHRRAYSCAFVALLLAVAPGCSSRSPERSKFPAPPGYSFSTVRTVRLPEELSEISGMAYYPKDSSIFCQSDEDGYLYKVSLRDPKRIREWKFAKKADYEDIVMLGHTFYLLVSNGKVMKVAFDEKAGISTEPYELRPLIEKTDEFEAMYYEPNGNKLVLLCKKCGEDDKRTVSAFDFSLDSLSFSEGMKIAVPEQVLDMSNGSSRLKPSAAAIHPVTGELYILASVDKLLVIADRAGNIRRAFKLDPKLFPQPEGLCFTPSGDMLISNEAADVGSAKILYFPYQKTSR